MGKKYLKRVGNLIQRKVTQLLLMESKDPRLAEVTITDVTVNRDTSRAEVFYSIIGDQEERQEVQAALDHAAGWMRAEMAPTLRLRNIPELVFTYDPSLAYGAHMEELLDRLQEEREVQEHDQDHDDE